MEGWSGKSLELNELNIKKNDNMAESKYSEDVRQHLSFIQNVITRMNSNSFSMKGWMVAIVSALAAVYASDSLNSYGYLYFVVGIPVVLIFCGLDAYYLKMEKQYRDLYDKVLSNPLNTDFDMNASVFNRTLWSAFRSPSVWILYVSVLLLLLTAIIILI